MSRAIYGAVLFLVIGIIGCGETDSLGRRPVSGKVTLAGQPLEAGSISFEPVGKGVSAGAPIVNGTYSISATDGLPIGSYIARISSPIGGSETPDAPGESDVVAVEQIPSEFNSASTQKVEVSKDGNNSFDFEIPKKAN